VRPVLKYSLGWKQQLIPPVFLTNEMVGHFFMRFHSSRPWITVLYVESPVAWTRILVYGDHVSDKTYRVLYNSSYYFRQSHQATLFGFFNYVIYLSETSSEAKRMKRMKIRVYDITTGKPVGSLEIMLTYRTAYGIASDAIATDMVTLAWYFPLVRSRQVKFMLYNILRQYKGKEVVFTMVHNNTIIVNKNKIPNSYTFQLFIEPDISLIYISISFIHNFEWVVFRNTHRGFTRDKTLLVPWPVDLEFLESINNKTGVYIGRFKSDIPSYRAMGSFEIVCFARKPLISEMKPVPVRPLDLGTHWQRKHIHQFRNLLSLALNWNILQLRYHRNSQRNYVFDVVNLYTGITDVY
jgi:hypothetical protein